MLIELKSLYEKFKIGALKVDSRGIEQYDRKVLTQAMCAQFEKAIRD